MSQPERRTTVQVKPGLGTRAGRVPGSGSATAAIPRGKAFSAHGRRLRQDQRNGQTERHNTA